MPTFCDAYPSYIGRDPRSFHGGEGLPSRYVLAEWVNVADPAPKTSLSLLCKGKASMRRWGLA